MPGKISNLGSSHLGRQQVKRQRSPEMMASAMQRSMRSREARWGLLLQGDRLLPAEELFGLRLKNVTDRPSFRAWGQDEARR